MTMTWMIRGTDGRELQRRRRRRLRKKSDGWKSGCSFSVHFFAFFAKCDDVLNRYKNQREKDRELNIEKKKIRDELARAERQKDEVDRKLEKMSIRSSCLGIDRNGRCDSVAVLMTWVVVVVVVVVVLKVMKLN